MRSIGHLYEHRQRRRKSDTYCRHSFGTVKSMQKIASETGGGPALDNVDRFGSGVSSLGDLDGDGVADLAVGAGWTTSFQGALYVLFMNTDGTAKNSSRIASDIGGGPTLEGGDFFGFSVSSLGNVNGDGASELAVGAPNFQSPTGDGRGAVYVLFMQLALPRGADLEFTRVAQTGLANAINTNFDQASERDVTFNRH